MCRSQMHGRTQVPAAWKILQVQECSVGQVTEADNTICRVCGNSTFSLNPLNNSCDPCPSGAVCFGSDAFIPPEKKYHTHPRSTTVVSCPKANACEGNRTNLLACKQVSPFSPSFAACCSLCVPASMSGEGKRGMIDRHNGGLIWQREGF